MSFRSLSLPSLVAGYGVCVNVGSYGLFYYDKQQAIHHGWRVPEQTLQMSALAGGWIGGMLAINAFRHKTKKEPFRTIYGLCIVGNIAAVSTLAFFRKTPQVQSMLKSITAPQRHTTQNAYKNKKRK